MFTRKIKEPPLDVVDITPFYSWDQELVTNNFYCSQDLNAVISTLHSFDLLPSFSLFYIKL